VILYDNVGLILRFSGYSARNFSSTKILSPPADPKRSADHGPLPYISAGHKINRLYSKYAKLIRKFAVRNNKI